MLLLKPLTFSLCTPVSYTHLDVYKRQIRTWSETLAIPVRNPLLLPIFSFWLKHIFHIVEIVYVHKCKVINKYLEQTFSTCNGFTCRYFPINVYSVYILWSCRLSVRIYLNCFDYKCNHWQWVKRWIRICLLYTSRCV